MKRLLVLLTFLMFSPLANGAEVAELSLTQFLGQCEEAPWPADCVAKTPVLELPGHLNLNSDPLFMEVGHVDVAGHPKLCGTLELVVEHEESDETSLTRFVLKMPKLRLQSKEVQRACVNKALELPEVMATYYRFRKPRV